MGTMRASLLSCLSWKGCARATSKSFSKRNSSVLMEGCACHWTTSFLITAPFWNVCNLTKMSEYILDKSYVCKKKKNKQRRNNIIIHKYFSLTFLLNFVKV